MFHAALATVVNSLGHVARLDDLLARKLEAILASFGHHMCLERSQSLTSTRVTDYSNRKQLVQSWEHVEYSEHKARFFGLLLVMSSKHILCHNPYPEAVTKGYGLSNLPL